jgi:serine/threonine protein kinase
MTSSRGDVIGGRFRLRDPLGKGGQGSLWLADDEGLNRQVALKELVPPQPHDYVAIGEVAEIARKRMVQEAQALARVHHPAVVRVHDLFYIGDDPWIVMEYIEGDSLETRIREHPMDDLIVARFGLQVAKGLQAAHAAGVMHRDIKPANILAASEDTFVLIDFGIAKIPGAESLTLTNQLVGTIDYMAPERFDGGGGPEADLWSLGVTFYHALTGDHPFPVPGERHLVRAALAIQRDDPAPLDKPSRLADLISSLLRKDPAERATIAEVIEALTAILHRPRASHAPGPAERPPAADGQNGSRPSGRPIPRDHADRASSARQTAASRDRDRIQDGDLLARVGLDNARGMLLALDEEAAARSLSGFAIRDCAMLLQDVATVEPAIAGRILLAIEKDGPKGPDRVGSIANELRPETLAAILDGLDPQDAVRITRPMDAQAAGKFVKYLPHPLPLLKAMGPNHAGRILRQARPTTTVDIFCSDRVWANKVLLTLSESERRHYYQLMAQRTARR